MDPNTGDYQGMTALHLCCVEGHLDIADLLLRRGSNVDAVDEDGWTPLHVAAACDHKDLVTLLVRSGADLLACNDEGDMPFQITEDSELLFFLKKEMTYHGITDQMITEKRRSKRTILERDILRILREEGDINDPVTSDGATFLHIAVANFYQDLVKLLLKNGASVQVKDTDGWFPIHVAAYWNNEKALKKLIAQDVDSLKAVTNCGETPYELCENANLKLYIRNILQERARSIIMSGEGEDVVESKQTLDFNTLHNYLVKMTKLRRGSAEDIPTLKPLINLEAIERSSEKKSTFKETKRHASHIKSHTIQARNQVYKFRKTEKSKILLNDENIFRYGNAEAQPDILLSIFSEEGNEPKPNLEEKSLGEEYIAYSTNSIAGIDNKNVPNHHSSKIQRDNWHHSRVQASLDSQFPHDSLPYLKQERLQRRKSCEIKLQPQILTQSNTSSLSASLPPSPTRIRHSFKEIYIDDSRSNKIIQKTRCSIIFCDCCK